MGYQAYGIDRALVERVKRKLKHPPTKERIKQLLEGVTREDLQNRAKVGRLLDRAAAILGEPLSGPLREQIISFVLAQKIDPNNTFHLIKLWNMFR